MDRKKILLVTLGHFSCDINGGALPASLPFIRQAHNLDYQATGGIMLAYSCLASLIQPIFGLLADKHSKPWFIPLGVALAGMGITIMGFMSNYWAMCLGVAISGIGSAFFHPEGARFANRVSGASKGAGISIFSIGGNSGFILGPLLVSVFVGSFGLRGMSVFAVMALLMAAILVWQISIMPAQQSPAQAPSDQSAEQAPAGENNWREFSKLIVVIICRAMVFTGCNTFIPLYWVNAFNQSKSAAAFALVIFGAFGIGFNMLGGILSDKVGYVAMIRTAFFLMAPIVLVFGLASGLVLAYLLLPFLGMVLYLSFSSQVVLGQKLLAKNMGFASGITLGVASTLGGVAQPCLGWIADGYGLHSVFICLSAIAAIGAIFSLLLVREKTGA